MSQSVNDLIDQLRAQLDESNPDNITDAQLLQTLNRAQRSATNIVARKYESLFWSSTTTTTVGGQQEYDIPTDAFGRRVELVEIVVNGTSYECRRISNQQRTNYDSLTQSAYPQYYTLKKNKIELFPVPSSGVTVRIHYTKRPEQLVVTQGRITAFDSSDNYVIVDTLGDDIAVSTDGFVAYVNVVDYLTGEVKGTVQVAAIDTDLNQVTFKSSGLTRSTVLGRTVSTSLPTDIAVDDYICLVTGSCVSELDEAYNDYILQFSVVEIRRRLGEPLNDELAALNAIEDELKRIWSGRESSLRVRKSNNHYNNMIRRVPR